MLKALSHASPPPRILTGSNLMIFICSNYQLRIVTDREGMYVRAACILVFDCSCHVREVEVVAICVMCVRRLGRILAAHHLATDAPFLVTTVWQPCGRACSSPQPAPFCVLPYSTERHSSDVRPGKNYGWLARLLQGHVSQPVLLNMPDIFCG